jgi:hypothetical protein
MKKILLLQSILFFGCVSLISEASLISESIVLAQSNCPIPISNNLEQVAFDAAINNTKNPKNLEKYNQLWDQSQLKIQKINGQNYALVVTSTSDDNKYYANHQAKEIRTPSDVWVTPSPQVQQFAHSQANLSIKCLELRIKQYLGLRPQDNFSKFVEILVKPEDLVRPCKDPEINDRQCQLDFTNNNQENINRFEQIKKDAKGYPWTQLGYTYDWGNPNSHLGASEFIIKKGSNVIIKEVIEADNYLNSTS